MFKKEVEIELIAPDLRALEHLVEKGIYINRQDAIRDALRHLFRHHNIKPFSKLKE